MNLVILKFGGTSLINVESRKKVAAIVKGVITNGEFPVLVVSAIGRTESYSTDTLLSLVSDEYKKDNKQGTDLLMSTGEIISAVIMSDILNSIGIKNMPITGAQAGIITDNNFGNSNFINYDITTIKDLISHNLIPIVAGFQGISKDNYITTLGRGGGDTTASILGNILDANRIEIYTDVDGILTADPKIVNNPSLIKKISYDETFQLAEMGAKVINPKSVLIAKEKNIPLYIKNTFSDSKGTMISSDSSNNVITSITSMNNRVQIIINQNKSKLNKLLSFIATNNISLDLISIFKHKQIFTISNNDLECVETILRDLNIDYSYLLECSKISLIGEGMRGIPGVMAKIYDVLSNNNIEILQTADSHMSIWCLVYTKDLNNAINLLHQAFHLNEKEKVLIK